jgi:TolA-binding protein
MLALVSNACSLLHGDNEPTIASLGRDPVRLEDTSIEPSEAQAISAYRQYLETPDESEARPEAMRRVADLTLEADTLPQVDTNVVGDPVVYPQQVSDSIRLYQEVLALYPDRNDNDAVLYQLARAYEHNAEPEQSLATLARLIAQYPVSDYAVETQFRRGEILFVQGNYRSAEQAYQAVTAAGDGSPFYRQSLYKMGWCHFKQSLFDQGLDAFMALLDIELSDRVDGVAGLDHLGRADRELVDDTLRVVSLSFSYETGTTAVAEYFRRSGARNYEDIIYDRLGLLYLQKERYSDAARTFQAFADHNPYPRHAPAFQMRVIETYQQGKFPTLVLDGKKNFVERYKLTAEYWSHHDAADNPQVLELLKTTMTDLSRHYHALAQKHHKPDDYRQAAHWYRSYLDSFPESDEAPPMNFLLAELLFESGNYQLATREYERTAYEYGNHEKAADAGYASVLAYAKEESNLAGDEKQAWHRQSIENALRFASGFPEHPQALAVLSKSAENLLAAGETERAARVSRAVIDSNDASGEQQRVAWTVHAHAQFDLMDYLKAEHAYREVIDRTGPNTDDRPQLIERLAASIYKQGEAAQAAGDSAAAVEHFQQVRLSTPTASIVATAEFDAAAGLMVQEEWGQAATVLERFRKDYPDDTRQSEVTRRLAAAYLAAEQPMDAAVEFERIGHQHADQQVRREALWQSAELYEKAQRPRQAIAAYNGFVTQFPRPAEPAVEAMHRISNHYRAADMPDKQQHWLEALIKADGQAGKGRTERTRYLAARARFTLAESAATRYRAVRLDLPLKKSLATKKRLMEAALGQYAEAASYQVAEVTTASAYRTAQIYSQLGKALLDSQRPTSLSGEALEQYDILLEEQAYPFEEQAISLHETNVQRVEAGLYDAWIEKSLQALAQLVPARYAKLERSASYVEAIH